MDFSKKAQTTDIYHKNPVLKEAEKANIYNRKSMMKDLFMAGIEPFEPQTASASKHSTNSVNTITTSSKFRVIDYDQDTNRRNQRQFGK